MTVPNRGRRAVALLYGLVALTVPGVQGQTPAASEQKPTAPSTAAEKTSEAHQQKLAIGFRVRTLPFRSFSVMDNGQVMKTTTVSKVNYDSNYNTVNHSFMLGGGLTLEGRSRPARAGNRRRALQPPAVRQNHEYVLGRR
jgi:hypothetical protein